jgi:hypothetical protein
MDFGDRLSERNRQIEEARQVHRASGDQRLEGGAARVFQHQGQAVPVGLQAVDFGNAGDLELPKQLVLPPQRGDLERGGVLGEIALDDDWEPVAIAQRPIHHALAATVDLRGQGVSGDVHDRSARHEAACG